LEFLRLNSDELLSSNAFSSSTVHHSASVANVSQGNRTSSHPAEDSNKLSTSNNWNLIVDGANVLCYSALKVCQYVFVAQFAYLFFFVRMKDLPRHMVIILKLLLRKEMKSYLK
jgi:hypothetical protein